MLSELVVARGGERVCVCERKSKREGEEIW